MNSDPQSGQNSSAQLSPISDILQRTKDVLQNSEAGAVPTTVLPKDDPASPAQNSSNAPIKGITNILDALLTRGIINSEQYNSFKFEAVNTSKSVDQVLLSHNTISPRDLAKTYAEMRGMNYIDINSIVIKIEVLNKIPADVAKSSGAVVFEDLPAKAKVAMKDPLDLQKIKYLESLVGKKIEAYYAAPEDIDNVIDTKYGAQIGKDVSQALEEVGANVLDINDQSLQENVIGGCGGR